METQVKVLSPNYKWVILFIGAMVNGVLLGYQTSSMALMMPSISAEMNWTPLQMSNIMSAQGLGTTFLILFAGILLDKFSTKWMIALSAVVCGLMIFSWSFAQNFAMFFAAMIVFGLSSAIYQPALPKLNTLWFDKKDIYKTNGIMVVLASVGSLTANIFTPRLIDALGGWRKNIMLTSALCFVIALTWIIFAKDRKITEAALITDEKALQEKPSLLENIKIVCSTKIAWILIVSEFFSYGAQRCFVLYAATTLIKGWGLDAAAAGPIVAASNTGSIVELLVIPFIGDLVGRRKPMIVCGWLLRGGFAIAGVLAMSPLTASICFFISGMAAGAGIPGARTLLVEQKSVGALRSGTAMGLLMLFGRLGEVVISNIYGAFIGSTGNHIVGVIICFIGFLIAAVMIATVPDTGRNAKKAKA